MNLKEWVFVFALPSALAACGAAATPLPPLVAGLDRLEVSESGAMLYERLKERIGDGTTEIELVRSLKIEGFRVGRRNDLCSTEKCASFEWWPNRVGGMAWTVNWSADRDGRVIHFNAGASLLN